MTRAEFLAYLARAVADPNIRLTETEAVGLLRDFDAGLIAASDLPLPLDQAVRGLTRDDLERIMIALSGGGLLGRNRTRARDRLREAFGREARQRATRLAADDLTLSQWQADTRDAVREHIAGQAILGAGNITGVVRLLADLDRSAREQTAYVSRFADAIMAGALLGATWSVAALASRSISYAGVAWAWFTRARENDGDRMGWVVDYIAKDDNRTCGPCSRAADGGPYLLGEGPIPGQICLGGGACRCERRERYDPDVYTRLARRVA